MRQELSRAGPGLLPGVPYRSNRGGAWQYGFGARLARRAVDERHTGFDLPSADPICDVVRASHASGH